MRIIIIAIAMMLLPFSAAAQMKCPDGSYRDRCPSGAGQEFESGGMSTYSAPRVIQRPSLPVQRQQQRQQRGQVQSSTQPSQSTRGPMSVDERARTAGISRNDLVRARSRGTIIEGMMEQDMRHILGAPDSDHQSNQRPECRLLWWYDRYNRLTDSIYLCNGQVRSHDHYPED